MPGEGKATGGKGMGAAGPPEQEQLPCPRCESSNTKFCYYNNYNFSQPRHFCKSCRRYWTQGGTLRDIPVGGGTRKTNTAKRPRTLPGSFTSLLNAGTSPAPTTTTTTPTTAFLSFGSLWGFPPLGYMPTHGATLGGLMRTWHMDTAADHPAGGFSSAELPISTTTGHALN